MIDRITDFWKKAIGVSEKCRLICFAICLLTLPSCVRVTSRTDDEAGPRYGDVRLAMKLAGDNRGELRAVLNHYRKDPDRNRYRAAKFLIGNMPAHWSYSRGPALEYCDSMLAVFSKDLPHDEAVERVNSLFDKYKPLMTKEYDVRYITADYLIHEIDYAFRQWEESPFLQHVKFADFCEYVLPYRCFDGQFLTHWKEENALGEDCELSYMQQIDEYKDNARKGAEIANEVLSSSVSLTDKSVKGMELISVPVVQYLEAIPSATCREKCILGVINCRANAIPVSMDYSPAWGDRNGAHCWNNVLCTVRNNIDYFPFTTNPSRLHQTDTKHDKVYRGTYSMDPESLRLLKRSCDLSYYETGICFADVTSEYGRTADLCLKVGRKCKKGVAYLAVFNNDEWKRISASIVRNGRAHFHDVGLGMLYDAIGEDEEEQQSLIAPFFLDLKGDVHKYKPDHDRTVDIHLTRKFPAFSHIYKIKDVIHGGIVEAGNGRDIPAPVQMCEFPEWNLLAGEENTADSCNAYRFWRIRPSGHEKTVFAELFFHSPDGSIIRPENVWSAGTGRVRDGQPEYMFDGDPLTYFAVPDGEGAVMDFGHPVIIGKVSYIRRGDGNDIFPGDEYEFLYWEDGGWRLHDRVAATDTYLDFHDVPSGTLYFIRDCTRGSQNRVFEYKDGEVVWR